MASVTPAISLRVARSPEPTAEELQEAARVRREKEVTLAWKQFKAQVPRHIRHRLRHLPPTGVYRHDPGT